MASCEKDEDSEWDESKSKDLGDANLQHEEYIHNPEEFIDIHGNERNFKSQSNILSNVNSQRDINNQNVTQTDYKNTCIDSCSLPSITSTSTIQELKIPVQVSEECDRDAACTETEKKQNVENSDDEYQSANEGGDDSDYEFIPVGYEENELYKETLDDQGDIENPESAEGVVNCEDESSSDDESNKDKEPEIVDEIEERKKMEELLTEEEKLERKNKSQQLKDEGNSKFRNGDFDEALEAYSEALDICPLNFHKERSIMFANRAACKMKKEMYDSAIKDSTCAIELHPHYIKALLRRAELYEKTTKLDEALSDYQKVVELDPSQYMARAECMEPIEPKDLKLAEQIKDRNEKMKEEMIGKLKDLGNLVLRPFGLSVNNFNLQKDPDTGSYSVQFQQKAPGNGS